MEYIEVSLLDKNGEVQYGLNWGNRDNRDPNEAYLQLTPDVYKSNFFPEKGIFFVVETDDNQTLILNRAQKGVGTALQTPENNATLGKYIRNRIIVPENEEITTQAIMNSGITKFIFKKIDDRHYRLSTNKTLQNGETLPELGIAIHNIKESRLSYIRAMRTKPFLLLAGISGTGKSRIVKEMAFDSCPIYGDLCKDPTSPGNYCLVEVKPNWHDSTELLGYESKINGAEYVVTPFVKFLAKAILHPDTPFFVCLDEMNLAPVEQYFAEFLSVLESRKKINGHIVSEPIIKPEIFANKDYALKLQDDLFGLELKEELTEDGSQRLVSGRLSEKAQAIYDELKRFGLRIPENVIVVGTVNMDETTHQFSRKVIDRAMTIEMNLPEGDPFMDFYNSRDLEYRNVPIEANRYLPSQVSASEALDELAKSDSDQTQWLKKEIAKILTELNAQLEDTPFKIAYRVQNELVLYFFETWREDENKDMDWSDILKNTVDQILMMKVLPRIQGDEELLEKPLEKLADFCAPYPNALKKIKEMKARLDGAHFTSFWP